MRKSPAAPIIYRARDQQVRRAPRGAETVTSKAAALTNLRGQLPFAASGDCTIQSPYKDSFEAGPCGGDCYLILRHLKHHLCSCTLRSLGSLLLFKAVKRIVATVGVRLAEHHTAHGVAISLHPKRPLGFGMHEMWCLVSDRLRSKPSPVHKIYSVRSYRRVVNA